MQPAYMDSSGLNLLRVQSWSKPSWQVAQTGVLSFWKQKKKKSRGREKGADRTAVWRIGAQSEGVEKSLHLNAPLHPNNSSASDKAKKKRHLMLYLSLSSLCFTLYPSSCEGHTPGCHPSGPVCVHACVLMWVYLKRFWGGFLGLIALTASIVHVDLAAMAITMHVLYNLANHSITALLSSFLWSGLTIGRLSALVCWI